MNGVLIENGNLDTHAHRDNACTEEGRDVVMLLYAKEHHSWPANHQKGAKPGEFSSSQPQNQPYQCPDLRLLAFRTVTQSISIVYAPQSVELRYGSSSGLIYWG